MGDVDRSHPEQHAGGHRAQTFKPIFERNIKDTLEATPQEIEPFTPPPAEGFENKDSILLTRAGLPENGVTAAVTGEGAIGGSSSFKIDYPDTEDWLLAAGRTRVR